MKARLLVISDSHLGGAPATDGKPAFQMCTGTGRAALVRFVEWAAGLIAPSRDVHLVVAGDIVDFSSDGRIVDIEATYLNSGTWADLMAVLLDILGNDGEQASSAARERLRTFADDLAANKVDRWRGLLPTFVDVTLDGHRILAADVCLFGTEDRGVPVTSEMIREQLQGDEP